MVAFPFGSLVLFAALLAWAKFTQTKRAYEFLWIVTAACAFLLGFGLMQVPV